MKYIPIDYIKTMPVFLPVLAHNINCIYLTVQYGRILAEDFQKCN